MLDPWADVQILDGIVYHGLDLSIICLKSLQVDNQNVTGLDYQLSFLYSLCFLAISALPTIHKHLRFPHKVEAVIYTVFDVRVIELLEDFASSAEQFFLCSEDNLCYIIKKVGISVRPFYLTQFFDVQEIYTKRFEEIFLIILCDIFLEIKIVQFFFNLPLLDMHQPRETKNKPVSFVSILQKHQNFIIFLLFHLIKDKVKIFSLFG